MGQKGSGSRPAWPVLGFLAIFGARTAVFDDFE
jgi:hypothetical protein